jgi:hypothetical protein
MQNSQIYSYVFIFLDKFFSNRYFIRTGFKNKKKRQELAEKLFSMYDQDVFSSEVNFFVF